MSKAHLTAFCENGEIDKQGIDKTAHTIIDALVSGIKAIVDATSPAIGWLQNTFTVLYSAGSASDFVDALNLLYALCQLPASLHLEPLVAHPVAANYFMFSCLSILDEIVEGETVHGMD